MGKLCSCFTTNNHNRKEVTVKSKKSAKAYGYGLLLSGDDESGKTTIIQKMTALCDPFTQQEKIDKIPDIKRYIRDSLTYVLRAFDQIIPPVQLEHLENHRRATYILTTAHETDFDYPPEFYEHVTILWADAGVQFCVTRYVEQNLSNVLKYFFDRINEVKDPGYIPSTTDMAYCRFFTSQVFKIFFKHQRVGFHLFEMDLRRDERREWIEYFHNIIGIIFITDCSCFNLISGEDKSQNQLQQSLDLYRTIRQNQWLRATSIILLLNKQDLLANKIQNGIQLEDYFPDFDCYVRPSVVIDTCEVDEDPKVFQAKHFICDQFLRAHMVNSAKYYNYYPHFTCDADITVSLVVDDCRSIIVRMHLRQYELL